MDKDVRRTDCMHPFFAGEDNPNVAALRRILLTYSMYNFDLGYCQVRKCSPCDISHGSGNSCANSQSLFLSACGPHTCLLPCICWLFGGVPPEIGTLHHPRVLT